MITLKDPFVLLKSKEDAPISWEVTATIEENRPLIIKLFINDVLIDGPNGPSPISTAVLVRINTFADSKNALALEDRKNIKKNKYKYYMGGGDLTSSEYGRFLLIGDTAFEELQNKINILSSIAVLSNSIDGLIKGTAVTAKISSIIECYYALEHIAFMLLGTSLSFADEEENKDSLV